MKSLKLGDTVLLPLADLELKSGPAQDLVLSQSSSPAAPIKIKMPLDEDNGSPRPFWMLLFHEQEPLAIALGSAFEGRSHPGT